MEVTTKELRIQPGKILDHVVNGQEVTVSFRGKAVAKIVSLKKNSVVQKEEDSFFGMWKDHEDDISVEEQVRDIRKGRQF